MKGAHNIFQDLGAKMLAIVTGKQEQRHTDETPVVQPFRIVHQDEARRMQNRFLAWCDEQAVLSPRLVEQTGPKLRERSGHIQAIAPQIVQYRPRTTDGMQPVSAPHTPIPEAHKEAEQVRKFDPSQLPPWIQELRDGSLLVSGQEADNLPPKDASLMTLRQPSMPLPSFLGFSDPDIVPDLPTEKRKPEDFTELSWLNSPMPTTAETQDWTEPAPSVLAPMRKDLIAAQDRIAEPRPLDDDDTLHVLRAVKPAKESEE